MAEYLRPDVYVEEIASGEKPIQAVSTSTGALIGMTVRGEVGKPVLVTSWTEFVNKFALGCDTPFLKNSDLPNAVYGFFQNGGARCYVVRVASPSAKVATCEIEDDGLEIHAKDVGTWANDVMKVKVVTGIGSTFNVLVYMKNELVETIENVSNNVADANYFADVINETSNYIKIAKENDKLLVTTSDIKTFAGGIDAYESVNNSDYTGERGLTSLDTISDVNLIAIPGKTEKAIASALLGYCDTRNDCFAIIDSPQGADLEAIKTYRDSLGGTNGALYYPWGKISDPIGRSAKSVKLCPPSGHVMGVFARTDNGRGVYKAPAGEDCVIRGFADLETNLKLGAVDILNPKGINCIITKPNKGIIIWGARSLSSDTAKRYVSDVRFDLMVRKSLYEGTQWAVFEPNDSTLWEKVDTSLRSFLDTQWRSGALRGASSEEAYYVKCDAELNNESAINNGQLVAEIGYAKQKPAEFVIIKIIQKQSE